MSTASESSSATENRTGHYAKFDEYVDYQVSKTGSHIKANDLLTTAVGISTILLGYLLIFVVCDHWFIKGGFGHTARLLMLVGVVFACLGWAVWKLILPYFKKVTPLYSAHALEQASEEMEGSLLNLIDLKKSNRPVKPEIINSLEKKAALTLSKTDTDQAIDRRPLMRLSYGLLAVVALLCFYALFSPKEIWPSLSAAMSFSPQREFATQTQINSVTPGNTEVLSGSQLEVTVDLRGEVPDKIMLYYTSSDQGRVNEPVKLRSMDDTLKRYQGVIVGVNGRGIRQELTYHVEAGDAVSDEYQVQVIQPPSATVHSVRYGYPQYMNLAAVEQPGGAIDAWEGTKVTVDATTNMPITSFEVLFSDEEDSASLLEEFQIEKTIEKNTISATWKLKLRADGTFPGFYQIKCRNEAGQTTLSPTVYPLVIRPDLPPEISLLSPKQDLKLPANGTVPISVVAEDPDFKIRYLNLRVDKEQIRILDKTIFEGAEQSVGLNHDFVLEPLRLTPGDTIYFWVEARDNKHPSGNRKNTPKIKIEILEPVSREEAKKQLEEQKQKSAQQNQKPDSQQKKQPEQGDSKEPQPGNNPGSQPKPDQPEKGKDGEKGTKEGDQSKEGMGQKERDKDGQKQSDSKNPQKTEDPASEPNQQKSDEKQGLDSDGKDDQEAIKKILEQLKKEGQQPDPASDQKQPGSEKTESGEPSSDQKMQDQKSSNTSQKPNQSPSKSTENSQGTPDGSENKNSAPQPSSKSKQPDKDPKGKQKPNQSGPVPKGKKEPSAPSEDAMKTKSDGKTEGKGTPNHDPNAKPEKSSQNVERDPKDKPAMRPGKKNESPANDSQQKPKPGGNQNSSPEKPGDPMENKPQEGMRKPANSNQNPSPSGQQKPSSQNPSKQKQDQPDGSNEPPKGKNNPTDQKSKRPQEGESGNSSQNDQGQSGSKQSGKGDSTGQKGNQEQGSKKEASNSKPSMDQNQSGKKGGQESSGKSKSGAGKKGSQSSEKGGASQGQGSGKSKSDPKPGAGSSTGSKSNDPQGSSATNGGQSSAEGDPNASSGENSNLPEAEEANLEYGKEAANLVLKRIKDELKRKDVDQELMNELGWTKEEMQKFSERLQKQLQTPDSDQQSAESLARKRQFEEMLKSLKPASRAAQRDRTSTRKQTNESLGPRRLPVPEEYREAYEAFTRGLAEKKASDK
ncbi:hypothetical protein [uncultured Gimesia sp.]|mgnify:CR=1 FL=1|uniref:hypothetical protein n=1 Tax=uncultured Gimesia sp. TaxID=1678688 RepID=UPI0030D873A9|tara:strand:+ start:111863 stop:115417 length:3555 start_codon:yes stop_codon:yes gene_type:complete